MGARHKEASTGWRHTRRPVATAVGVALIVLVLVVLGGLMIKYTLEEAWNRTARLSLDDIARGVYAPKGFNGTFVSDSDIMFKDSWSNSILYNLYSLVGTSLTPNYHVIPVTYGPIEYQISHSKHYLLTMHNRSQLPGQTPLAQYELIDIRNQTSESLKYINDKKEDGHLLQLAMWTTRRSEIVFAYHNDLYFQPNPALRLQLQLTNTGIPGVVFNGVTNYIYREVILKTETAIWPSPNGQRLAFATFNDTNVHSSYIPFYGNPGSLNYQYPENLQIHYPKAGTPLPTVTLSVIDLDHKIQRRLSTLYAPIPEGMAHADVILTAVSWINNDELASVWMNRLQTYATITVFNYHKGNHYDLLKVNEYPGWLEPIAAPYFSSEEQRMVLILPQDQGDGDGKFPHVCLVQQSRGRALVKPLTTGKYSVKKILSWDKLHNQIYFLATEIDSPSIQHLYSVSDDQWTAPNTPICITCSLHSADGMPCLYNLATFNMNNTFYMVNCAGPGVPEIIIFDRKNTKVMIWENNIAVKRVLQKVGHLRSKQYLQIDIGDGFKAHVELRIPPDYNPKRNKKYPLLVFMDGSPDTCHISEEFSVDWNDYVTMSKNVVVALISARGSGLRGSSIANSIYRRLGTVEIDDIIHVTRNIQNLFTFIDKSHTAIWGRYYGGYTTIMTLIKDEGDVFKCGLALSPITEWIYYDAVQAERYMHSPTIQENLAGYIEAGVTNKVENLRYKKFMLIHSSSDSSVHYQHSMMLAKELQHNGILFSQHTYPDETGEFLGVTSHLYHTMDRFLDSCFNDT